MAISSSTLPVTTSGVGTQQFALNGQTSSPANAVAPSSATSPTGASEETAAATTEDQSTAPSLDAERLRAMVEQAQRDLPPKARNITFSMNEDQHVVVVKIIDRESEEVIRQIPSEEFLKIAEALNEQIEDIRAGLLLEQKA